MSIDPNCFSSHPSWTGPRRYAEQKWQIDQAAKTTVGVPSHNLGPESSGFIADWIQDRLKGKPFASERWYVQASGQVVKTPY